HACSDTDKLCSDIMVTESPEYIGLVAESAQLGRERRSYGGVPSPEKEPNDGKKLSSSAPKDVSDDEFRVESTEVAGRFGKAS
ncbi:MAG: hypothetical protein Q9181_006958, partial [Wetmoreana brouardii]